MASRRSNQPVISCAIRQNIITLNTSMAFAVIIVLSAMGLVLYGVVELIERLLIPWHVSRRGGAKPPEIETNESAP